VGAHSMKLLILAPVIAAFFAWPASAKQRNAQPPCFRAYASGAVDVATRFLDCLNRYGDDLGTKKYSDDVNICVEEMDRWLNSDKSAADASRYCRSGQ
jgi:hypothetical protein